VKIFEIMLIEICTPTIQSAINAQIAGANRIELCENLREGGTTPSAATILLCKKYLKIPTFVLIRARGGDFCYSDLEMEVMLQDIEFCKKNSVDGVVIGALHPDRTINIPQTQAMISAAGEMSVTFHRAFDRVKNPFAALEQLKKMNIHRILTSGQADTALNGVAVLKKLIEHAENQLIILPGSGITPNNMNDIIAQTACKELHFSAKKTILSKMDNDASPASEYWESDVETIKKAVLLASQNDK
jgi:copper homeostasis protein